MKLKTYQYYQPDGPPESGMPQDSHAPVRDTSGTVRRWLKRFLLIMLALLLICVLLFGWMGWQFFASSTKVFGGSTPGNAVQFTMPANLQADSKRRTNILIAGNSVDDPNHPGADLTDSILVLSLDPGSNKAFLISVPRDLLVRIPERGYQKINVAYPAGGMELLERIIESHLGLHIHYNVLVNYAAVRDTVNAVDGIDVVIDSSDKRGLYDPNIQVVEGGPLRLENGDQHLDGQTALNLVRARGERTPDGRVGYGFPRGDFDRSVHQQQVLSALKDRILTAEVLINPLRMSKVFDALGNNLQTDMEINQARRVANILRRIEGGDLTPVSLVSQDEPMLTHYMTANGQAALIPAEGINDFSDIKRYLQNLK